MDKPRAGAESWLMLAVFLGASALAAGLGGAFTATSVGTWYQELRRPGFAPPNWLFGPMWTLLYAMMAVAAWLAWRAPGKTGERRAAMLWHAIQLLLNAGWSIAFFGLRSPGLGLVWIVVLLVAIAATMRAFCRLDCKAALLMLPYLLWVAFAAMLNAGFWILNR